MNGTGRIFRVQVFGESHGPAVGAVIDGVPPGLALSADDFKVDLARRRAGEAGTTARLEADEPEILSGVYEGRCQGTPLCVAFRNRDAKPLDYGAFASVPRPGHAELTGRARYLGFADPRGGGHFSGRLTLGLVAAGVVAKKLLGGLSFATAILEAGGSAEVGAAVQAALREGDSVGAVVELRVAGLPAGVGEPFFGSVEGELARALFAVPGVRGVEFGDGFRAARMRGSEHNDPIVSPDGGTSRNGAGGVNGGVTNGNELLLRVAVKPASSIAAPQETLDIGTGKATILSIGGRHDACIAIRAAVALEAACAIVLADLCLVSRSHGAATLKGPPWTSRA